MPPPPINKRVIEVPEHLPFRPWPPGDPFVLLDSIIPELEENQRAQAISLYLDSVSTTLQAHQKMVDGMRAMVSANKAK